MMQKSPAYPPLDGLLDLACRDGVDIRPTLLRVLTDLYVQKPVHTSYEETQYVELAIGLIQAVDESTREAVMASLRNYPAAPTAILNALGAPPAAHAAITASAPPARPQAKAEAPVPPPAPEPHADDLIELFFAAAPDERRLILANLDVVDAPDFRAPASAVEAIGLLETAAMRRDPQTFSAALVRLVGIDAKLADRIVTDATGEAIVVIARGLGMKAAVLQRVLLFLNPAIGQSIERVYDLARLFDEMSPRSAAHMLSMWSKPVARKKPVHEPALYDDERRGARAASTPGRYAAPNRDVPAHLKSNRR